MIHWLGYAEIRFCENAHLVLARAVEQSGSDALSSLADAWLIGDRSISLHVEIDTPRGEMIAAKRLLSALLLEAEHGEAVIEVPPFERWSRSAGAAPSVHLGRAASVFDDSIDAAPDPDHDDPDHDEPDRQTIPMPAASRPSEPAPAPDAASSLEPAVPPRRAGPRS